MPIVITTIIDDVYPIPTALLIQQTRQIGELVPDVVIEEVGDDTVQSTKHPVETGATISDHAFRMPCTIMMKIVYSDTKHRSTDFIWGIYQKMLKIAGDRELLTVVSGTRVYQNMLITGIHVKKDETTEHILDATVVMEEIIIADTEVTSYTIPTLGPGSSAAGMSSTVPTGTAFVTPAPDTLGLPAIPFSPVVDYLGPIIGAP